LRNNPAIKDLSVAPLGSNGRPAPLLTKSLLFLGDSSDAVSGRAGTHGPVKFRAYDKATGQVVWEHELPTGTTGAPMTYVSGGKQYIVVPVGGQDYGSGWIAFALKN
jgi:quinoprotein glucose dehydrogenase